MNPGPLDDDALMSVALTPEPFVPAPPPAGGDDVSGSSCPVWCAESGDHTRHIRHMGEARGWAVSLVSFPDEPVEVMVRSRTQSHGTRPHGAVFVPACGEYAAAGLADVVEAMGYGDVAALIRQAVALAEGGVAR